MKRNAIARIVLWSVVLVVLLAILFTIIYVPGTLGRIRHDVIEETMVPVPITETPVTAPTERPMPENTAADSCNAVATHNTNVRTMPSDEAPIAGMVEQGTALEITRQELINGTSWGYSPAPVAGWMQMEFVELLEPIQENKIVIDTPVPQDQQIRANAVAMDAASIRNVEIEWAAGSILIQPKDIDEIYIMEDGLREDSDPMVWKVRENKLSIQYSKNTDHDFGMGLLHGNESKDLIIQVPFDWQCNSLEIDAASASLEVNDLTIQSMEFDGASGTCVFNNCTVERLELDTASGDVLFKGSLNQMECDSASANIILELNNVPRSIEMDTASGDLDMVLPEGSGFSVKLDTMSGDFKSDFTTTNRNGKYIAGDGRCQIEVDGMSGSVNIRKGQ